MITRVFGKKIENFYEVIHNWKQIEDRRNKNCLYRQAFD